MTWRREATAGGSTVWTSGPYRIESYAGRSLNGDRTGYRAGTIHLYDDGRHVAGHTSVGRAKAHAERLAS